MSKRILLAVPVIITLALLSSCSPEPEESGHRGGAGNSMGTPIAAGTLPETIEAGQVVYVPVHSHVYSRGARVTFDLTVTLSVRNTDRQSEIIVTRVEYHDTEGRLVREYLDSPIRLAALATTDFVIEESDRTGGTAPSFIVEWISASPVSEPIIEGLMIGTMSQQGISFLSRGQVLESR